uniref:Receptor kinase n=1 Tax=Solanum tuberosum TaxID=4113 RepID=M1AVS7_SOLTU
MFWESKTEDHRNIEAFLKNNWSYAPKRYTYSEVKEMTTRFKNKLGQGGYGNVYRGSLQNGKHVAVKVVNELKGSGEEFINEVASISRTSHVNIMSLVGFCFEGRKRALIYEFMPNGSLEKFIYEERSDRIRQLDWPILYQIALGIARGLEYLHRGCTTRILHFDIKPHNILLDEDFCPKISDFGLAKLCMKKESIVSMLGARGTIGYIAPEIVCRNLGGVSHKSDVYSYGMMVLEMVGGRKNVDVGVDRTSEIYFPHWLYRRIELDEELQLIGIMNKEEKECARKMSFSCGNLTDLSFPFSLSTQPDCGILPFSGCDAKPYPRIQLLPGGDWYYALGNPYNYTVWLVDPKLQTTLRQHKCWAFNKKFSLPDSPYISFKILNNLNFFKCNITGSNTPNNTHKNDHFAGYKMYHGCKGFSIYYKLLGDDDEEVRAGNLPATCSLIRLPVRSISDPGGLFNMLSASFIVEWKLSEDCYQCHYDGGQCQTDITNEFHCTYPYNPHAQGLVHIS